MAALFFYSDFIGFSCGTFTSIITKSDEVREYGATVFLKWLTSKEQNTRFTLKTGYLPVKNDVYNEDSLLREVSNLNINEAVIQSFEATNKMFKDYTFYSQRPFPNSYQLRSLIGNHLYDKILKDLDILKVRMENGEKRYEILNEMIAEDQFEEWFINFQLEADLLLK